MRITIEATKDEIEEMEVDLYRETGQQFDNEEQVAAGLSCMIDERIELPGYTIKIKVIEG
jgi:hypothetical protein